MKVLVAGSRSWVDLAPIQRELRALPKGTILIHGACRGADNTADYVGRRLGMIVRPYPANWGLYARGAGPVRNAQMLKEEHPDKDGLFIDLCLAFHKDVDLGTGTADMKRRVLAADPPIEFRWIMH